MAKWWLTFAELIAKERAWLSARDPVACGAIESAPVIRCAAIDEPWITFTARDHFGVALSGGGIRSATFNLGVLQALGAKGILDHVDYLSTVSGGGYIGGFWTALRAKSNDATPAALRARPPGECEPPEVRHLREFSRFLMPRVGFAVSETWVGIVAVLGGMLPSLLAAIALIAVALYAWAGVVCALFAPKDAIGVCGVAVVALAIHAGSEISWQRSGKGGATAHPKTGYFMAALASVTFVAAWWLLRDRFLHEDCDATKAWWISAWAIMDPPQDTSIRGALFGPALLALLVGLAFLFAGAASSRLRPTYALDRSTGRCFAAAVVWALGAATWEVARLAIETKHGGKGAVFGTTFGGAAATGGLFVWLRDWLAEKPEETRGSALFRRILGFLKPLTPQLLALAAVWLLIIGTAALVQTLGKDIPIGVGCAAFVLMMTAALFDPARIGLHEFYRARIARCFLGAAHTASRGFHATLGQDDDECYLDALGRVTKGPIHLVCCAANNLSGDVLSNLHRGARSAAISPFGLSIGGFARPLPSSGADGESGDGGLWRQSGLGLSAVLTASGAAFNSQMGALSMRLGPSVAFLMTALSLRLGLWLPHPLSRRVASKSLPGRFLLREAFSATSCDPVPRDVTEALSRADVDDTKLGPDARKHLRTRSVHLSDGGHFENLGLYELVRRHCRYVIVSDASADPKVAFDDLANAVRRVREDFGVEIELDVDPLRPDAERLSKQHAVVGTIHYDGMGGTDKGIVLYFKPTLVGEEPTDIMQYRVRNPAFPHEGTVDQFYDEAQWESYRRLGEHAVLVATSFIDRDWPRGVNFVERMFQEASQRWSPAQRDQGDIFLELSGRCAALESSIRESAPLHLRAEFFPEVAAALGFPAPQAGRELEEELRTVYFLMQVTQIMEDVWLGAQLERYWSHPLNEGWMSYFRRWTSTPSFRRWWPLLRPIYGVHFRDFVRDRFGLRVKDPSARPEERAQGARLTLRKTSALAGLAVDVWKQRFGDVPGSKHAFDYHLDLMSAELPLKSIQVGFLSFTGDDEQHTARWRSSSLFVSPALIGGGIVSRLLDAVLAQLRVDGWQYARVCLDEGVPRAASGVPSASRMPIRKRDPASRAEYVSTINFYKSRGFVDTGDNEDGLQVLEIALCAPNPAPRAITADRRSSESPPRKK